MSHEQCGEEGLGIGGPAEASSNSGGGRVAVREWVRVVTRGLGGHWGDCGVYFKEMDGFRLCDMSSKRN